MSLKLRDVAIDIATTLRNNPSLWLNNADGGTSGAGPCCLLLHLARREIAAEGREYDQFCDLGGIPRGHMGEWNDAPGRTVEEVIAVCEQVAACAGATRTVSQ
jgi:hypothetical protein